MVLIIIINVPLETGSDSEDDELALVLATDVLAHDSLPIDAFISCASVVLENQINFVN